MLDLAAKPSIIEVVGRYVDLRRSGKELTGLCPFHTEKTPSFTVNEEKGFFYCHGCHEGGDAIRFIEKIENVDFKGAIEILGFDNQPRPTRTEIKKRQILERASRNLTVWALNVAERVGSRMREVGQREYRATKVLNELDSADREFLQNELERASREWIILTTLEEDLLDPIRVVDLWREKELIEQLVETNRTYSNEDIENMYPPITDDYKQRLAGCVRGEG